MKQKFSLCLMAALISIPSLFAQGKFAGSYRSLLKKVYQNKAQLPLPGFALQGGTFMGDLSVSWYRKGNLAVVLFESISKDGYQVYDVLQLSNLSANQTLCFADCLNARAIEDESIVALVMIEKRDLLKAISAWRWNDQIKALEAIDKIETGGISCPKEQLTFSQRASARWRPFLNKVYKGSNEISELKDYTLREGATLPNNVVAVSSYAKGNSVVLVFERIVEDNFRFVFDIVETTLAAGQDIRIGLCKKGDIDDGTIVAVVKSSSKERWQAEMAWVCDLYHMTVKALPANEVTCLGNYGEN